MTAAVPPPGIGWPRDPVPALVEESMAEATSVERVLIADDHPMVRDGLRSVISVAFDSCETFEAATLDETIAVIEREGDFDLVMLDVNMPGARGISGLVTLRRRFPALPIVMVSAECERDIVSAALSAGAAGFIPKSLKRGAIVEALKSVLAGEIYVPANASDDGEGQIERREIMRRIEHLTPQQKVVLGLLVEGKLNKQIAYELDVSMTTVKAHVSAILAKLNVFSRTQAVIMVNKVGFDRGATGAH
ncbi:response regulator transcription factor [Sphingomonas sp. AP4-R1]|uniref:response regulator n=1 Tax=Sphingomonas sp. AP4-R1 TaxID=2735134 RepID=UPI00149399B5|nr:response regulator transcription factor [Sphingomonas sp. AP4-R1]QJU60103.1 response regulator transcription factor [Sphingomonas sp. AP4-R1]